MSHNKTIFKLLMLLALLLGTRQSNSYAQDPQSAINEIGQEKIYVHYTSSLFFVGEYLYYKLYCLNSKTSKLSGISKTGYLQLVGENGKVLFNHKIRLDDGSGQGDFFIPVSVPSGNYKLVGYTHWMKNWGQKNFFKGDVTIINPYSNNQRPFLLDQPTADLKISNNYERDTRNDFKKNGSSLEKSITLSLSNGKEFGRREKVMLALKNEDRLTVSGSYSLSIKKIDDFKATNNYTATTFTKELDWIGSESLQSNDLFLPELRGELVEGRLITDVKNFDRRDVLISLTIPGDDYTLKVGKTDSDGNFYFNLDKYYDGNTAIVQVLSENDKKYEIAIEQDSTTLDHSELLFHSFRLSPAMDSTIVARSIHNQIENAFYRAKPDTLFLSEKTLFYGDGAKEYLLDDYTRFPTLKETIVEILEGVLTQKAANGSLELKIREFNKSEVDFKYKSLLIVDGLIVQNHDDFLDYNPNKIERVNIYRNTYRFGAQIFQGIMDVKTFDSDYLTNIGPSSMVQVNLLTPRPKKKYFRQMYNDSTQGKKSKVPDLRHQLLWLPDLTLDSKLKTIHFFTSDVVGKFEIRLEGFTGQGRPISLSKVFTVH